MARASSWQEELHLIDFDTLRVQLREMAVSTALFVRILQALQDVVNRNIGATEHILLKHQSFKFEPLEKQKSTWQLEFYAIPSKMIPPPDLKPYASLQFVALYDKIVSMPITTA